MEEHLVLEPIPLDVALQLCTQIRKKAEVEWWTSTATWCFACQQSAGGDPAKRGIYRAGGNRGCTLVNARFAELMHHN